MPQLYLVGTHHMDLKGPERLKKFLEFVRPDTIGLEATVEDYHRRIQDHAQFRSQRVLLQQVLTVQYGPEAAGNAAKYFDMLGYELWVPSEFSRNNGGVSVVNCDEYRPEDVRVVTQEIFGDRVNEAREIKPDFVDRIAEMNFTDYQRTVDSKYYNDSVAEIQRDPALFESFVLGRDERAEPRIREAFSATDHTMVYVGGTAHFFGEYEHNLYERLCNLSPQPQRIRLIDLDKF